MGNGHMSEEWTTIKLASAPHILPKATLPQPPDSELNWWIPFFLNETKGKIMQSNTISNTFSPLQDTI